MTTQEADVLRFIELRGGMVTDRALHQQFGMELDVALSSLLRHLQVEQDRHHYRITSVGEMELAAFSNTEKRAPFAGRAIW